MSWNDDDNTTTSWGDDDSFDKTGFESGFDDSEDTVSLDDFGIAVPDSTNTPIGEIPKISPESETKNKPMETVKNTESTPPSPKQEERDLKAIQEEISQKIPQHNQLLKFINEFSKISEGFYSLSELAQTVINELDKANKKASESSGQVTDILQKYDTVSMHIHGVINETQKYFELNKTIVHNLADQKRAISNTTKEAVDKLKQVQQDHIDIMQRNIEYISQKLDSLAKDIDLTEVQKSIHQQITTEIKKAGLGDFGHLLESVKQANEELAAQTEHLLGNEKDKKIGTLERFGNLSEKFATGIKEFRQAIKYSFLFAGAVGGVVVGIAIGYFYSTINYENRFTQEMGKEIRNLQEVYQNKLQSKEEELVAFKSFKRKYGLDENSSIGFGYFNDTKTPFFYYPETTQTYKVKKNIIVELPN